MPSRSVRGVQTTKIIVIPGTWKPGDISRWEDVRVNALTTVDFVIHTVHDTVTASAACDALSAAALELVCCTRRAGAGARVALQRGDALQMFKITSYFCRVRAWNSLECSPFFFRLNPFTSSNKTGCRFDEKYKSFSCRQTRAFIFCIIIKLQKWKELNI